MNNNKDLDEFVRNLFGGDKKKRKDITPNEDSSDTPIDEEVANKPKKQTVLPKNKQPINMKQWTKGIVVIGVVLAALVIAIANVYIVKENEYRIVRQFGEVVKFESNPGIYMKIPFIQSVETLPKNLQTYDMMQEEINTLDKKRIIIDNYAVWRVTDPKALISNARSLTNAEARMEEFIYSVLRTELGKLNYKQIINDENSSRGSINDKVTEQVNNLLKADNYGIEVVDVRIRRTDLPIDNEQSVYTQMISERESSAQQYLSEGDAEKNRIMAQTDKQVQEMLATAKKEAALITAEGESQAAKIYNESFSKDPEFYSLYRTLESYKKTINEDTVIILPSDSPYAKILSGYMD
ncbi:protease modulator HflC [Lysinibacillus sp. LZ02]|uniref:protease modulator HflC n=1 Tax=Lysinibacillus sp. LZ02 TaxID=3420668 RepID=UPI003D36C86E